MDVRTWLRGWGCELCEGRKWRKRGGKGLLIRLAQEMAERHVVTVPPTPFRSAGLPQPAERRMVGARDCECGEGGEHVDAAAQVAGPVSSIVARRKHRGGVVITGED
jgi:hypothetical protein